MLRGEWGLSGSRVLHRISRIRLKLIDQKKFCPGVDLRFDLIPLTLTRHSKIENVVQGK